MPDFPSYNVLPVSINSWMRWMSGTELRSFSVIGSAASSAWPLANKALYVPFSIPWQYPVAQMFWGNGSAAGGNIDIGLYTADGAQIYHSGSTVGAGNSALQYVAPSIVLDPGWYFIALATDNVTANRMQGSVSMTAAFGRLEGLYEQATAFPLPASATFAQFASAYYPLVGITRSATAF